MSARPRPSALGVLALAVLLAAGPGCAPGGQAAREAPRAASPDTSRAGEALPSLFELDFALTDSDGALRHLSDLRGGPFVASMIYTHCTSVCPRTTADLQALDRALPEAERRGVRFVLFSLDPARDTPEAMRRFAADHHLDRSRWTLLAAGEEDMRTLAAVLGVRMRPDGGGEIAHSAVIAVVDAEGVVRHRQVGVPDGVAPLVAAVRAVAAREAGAR